MASGSNCSVPLTEPPEQNESISEFTVDGWITIAPEDVPVMPNIPAAELIEMFRDAVAVMVKLDRSQVVILRILSADGELLDVATNGLRRLRRRLQDAKVREMVLPVGHYRIHYRLLCKDQATFEAALINIKTPTPPPLSPCSSWRSARRSASWTGSAPRR